MPAAAAKRRITRETVTEIEASEADQADETEDQDAADDLHPEAPLFSPLLLRAKKIEVVNVRRTDPEDAGKWIYLGNVAPDLTESSLKARWGGGTYRIEAKNLAGQVVKDGVRSVRLAGDPIFESEVEERKWRRANGLPDKAAAGAHGALSIKDLLVLMDAKDEKRRAEQLEREDRARKEITEREDRERHAREDREARAQKDADEREERRRREAHEDEERRTRAHREDMERLAASNAQALAQAQQFFTQLATTMKAEEKSGGDSIKNLLAGVQIARELGGGGGGGGGDAAPADLLTTVMGRLPETLEQVRRMVPAVAGEIRGRPAAGPAGAAPGQDYLTITGPTATQAKKVIALLAKAGKDPEAELRRLLTFAAAANQPDPPKRTPKPVPPAATSVPPPITTSTRRTPASTRRRPTPTRKAQRRRR